LGDLDIAEYAQRFGKARRGQLTVAELDNMRGIADDAEWHEIKKSKNLQPEDVIQVVIEEQPHWPTRNAMTNAESKAMLICDFAHGTRRVWRMVLPDGTPFAVAHHETKSEGLKQAFPPDLLPEVESGKK
jgi:hypothetical protein